MLKILFKVGDEASCYISKLRKLRRLSLDKVDSISEFGYATLLHNLPDLVSLGRCDHVAHAINKNLQSCKQKDKPALFTLEEIHCEAPISETDLDVIVSTCPKLSRVKIVYRPDDIQRDNQGQ